MRAFILICALALIGPSCTLVDKAAALVDKTSALADDVKTFYKESREEFKQLRASADTNKDGKTSVGEWWHLIVELALGGGLLASIRNGKSNERKARNEAKVDAQEDRLRKLEGVLSAPLAPGGAGRIPGA